MKIFERGGFHFHAYIDRHGSENHPEPTLGIAETGPGAQSHNWTSEMKAIRIIGIPEQAVFYVGAASRYLGISPNTLRKRADLGLIPAKRDESGNRVFLLEDLDAYRKSLPPYTPSDNPGAGRLAKTGRSKGGEG